MANALHDSARFSKHISIKKKTDLKCFSYKINLIDVFFKCSKTT